MDEKAVAKELTALAGEIVADAGWIKKSIGRFIDKNAEAIERDEYGFARIKIEGPVEPTKWMNVSLDNLERIAKAVR
jgi:hypothetical protein